MAGRGGAALEAASDGRALWLVGGFAGQETRDVLRYDLGAEAWAAVPSEWLRPRSVCASFSLAGSVFCFGGEVEPSDRGHEGAGGFADDLFALDSQSGEQLPVTVLAESAAPPRLPPARGWAAAAAVSGGQAVLFGGLAGDDAAPQRLGDAWLVSVRLQAARPW